MWPTQARGSVGPLLHQGRDNRGAHARVRRARLSRCRADLLIGQRRGLAQGAIGRVIRRQTGQMGVKILYDHLRRGSPCRVSAGAAGDNKQFAHCDANMEDGVLILLTQSAGGALLGEKNDRLSGNGYIAHA